MYLMSRTRHSNHSSTASDDLTLAEEDAYAHLVNVANEQASDKDKRKLIKAGLLPDPNAATALTAPNAADNVPRPPHPNMDVKQNDIAAPATAESRGAVPQTSRVRAAAIRFLILRLNGVKFKKALEQVGVEWLDIQRFRWSNPQFAVVQDFADRQRATILRQKATDAMESLIDGDKTAEARNAKAVMFALERLSRDQYADPKKDSGGKGGASGGGITYNITFQGGFQPNLCGGRVDIQPQPPIIDIKGE